MRHADPPIDRKRPVVAQIADRLRAGIIALELQPGSPLSRSGLAEQFGVSQTPVREALIQLEQQGLVEVYPQSGTLVSLIDGRDAVQALFLRTAIECEIVRTLALAPTRYDLAPARAALAQLQHLPAARDTGSIRPADNAFHAALCQVAGQPELWRLIVSRSGNIDRMRSMHLYPGKIDKIVGDHAGLLEAIAAGAVERAVAAMRQHIADNRRAFPALEAAHPAWFSSSTHR